MNELHSTAQAIKEQSCPVSQKLSAQSDVFSWVESLSHANQRELFRHWTWMWCPCSIGQSEISCLISQLNSFKCISKQKDYHAILSIACMLVNLFFFSLGPVYFTVCKPISFLLLFCSTYRWVSLVFFKEHAVRRTHLLLISRQIQISQIQVLAPSTMKRSVRCSGWAALVDKHSLVSSYTFLQFRHFVVFSSRTLSSFCECRLNKVEANKWYL